MEGAQAGSTTEVINQIYTSAVGPKYNLPGCDLITIRLVISKKIFQVFIFNKEEETSK